MTGLPIPTQEEFMRVIKLCALAVLVGLVGLACQSAPEDAGNAAGGEALAANATAATNTANATAAADTANATAAAEPAAEASTADQRPERPQPNAPRAEGDMLAELLAGGDYLLLDVRRPEELEERGTVEGYLNIPIEELADRLDEVPRDRAILTA